MKNTIAAAAVVALVGCGGGSGSGGDAVAPDLTPPATTAFPVEATFASLASTARQFSVNARDAAGNTLSLNVSVAPGPDKTNAFISATPKKTYMQTAILRRNGVVASTAIQEVYFSTAPFAVWGIVLDSETVLRADSQGNLPATAKVGDVGALYSAVGIRTRSDGFFDAGTVNASNKMTATWSMDADTASSAWLCMRTTVQRQFVTNNVAESDCFKVDAAGNVLAFRADVSSAGTRLEFR